MTNRGRSRSTRGIQTGLIRKRDRPHPAGKMELGCGTGSSESALEKHEAEGLCVPLKKTRPREYSHLLEPLPCTAKRREKKEEKKPIECLPRSKNSDTLGKEICFISVSERGGYRAKGVLFKPLEVRGNSST